MGTDGERRTFWQTYTLSNIRYEIAQRLAEFKSNRASGRRAAETPPGYDASHALSVASFYDRHHRDFLEVYGDVIQAFRTRDVHDLLEQQIASMGFEPDQTVLDAGCGVGAPAIYFARRTGIRVDAVTVSGSQYEAARRAIEAAKLADRIRVVHGDYHLLPRYFEEGAYDVVYFLESFGHSRAKTHLIDVCWRMLKPGGLLYVKDLFRRLPLRPEQQPKIDREIRKIDEAYRYEVGELNAVVDAIRRRGFILDAVRSVDLDVRGFEDLAISNKFQELTGIALIEDWDEYVFPVDFFELRGVKPEFDLDERLDRHFLQTRLHRASRAGLEGERLANGQDDALHV